jgi:hypothetical protein
MMDMMSYEQAERIARSLDSIDTAAWTFLGYAFVTLFIYVFRNQ